MLKKGILSSTRYYPNYSHNRAHLNTYFEEAEKVFSRIQRFTKSGTLKSKIKGTVSKPGFQRFA